MTRCEYIRVEFSQSHSRAAYFEDLAESREFRVRLRRHTVRMCMLCDANETFRFVLLFDHSLVISRLSTAVAEADYLARDLI